MKANGTMLGGSLKPKNFPAYAKYLVKFLQSYQAEGVPVDAISPQNEVDTDQDGRMPACVWAQEHEIVFVSQHLGPALEQNKIPAKIWILDHNFNLWGRVMNELENPLVSRYVDGVAWHPYVGSVTAVSRVHDLFPDKNMYWTEGDFDATFSLVGPMTFGAGAPGGAGPEPAAGAVRAGSRPPRRDPQSSEAIARAGVGAANAVRNWLKCIVVWNLVLDENGHEALHPRGPPRIEALRYAGRPGRGRARGVRQPGRRQDRGCEQLRRRAQGTIAAGKPDDRGFLAGQLRHQPELGVTPCEPCPASAEPRP
jgi:glucosylceramidase